MVPGTDLSTSVSVVDLNGVHHGVTTSVDGTDLNVPDLSTSVSVVDLNGVDVGATTSVDGTDLNVPDLSASESGVDLNGVDDSGTTSADGTDLIVHNEINMKGNQRDSILEDESDINCPDRSKENSVGDDKRICPIKIKTTITDANSVAGEQDGKFGVDPDIGKSQEGPIDVNANGIMCINDSHNAVIIDEKDIAIGRELEVETFTGKSHTDKEGKFGFNVNVHSTPVTKEQGATDSGEFINSSKLEYGNGSFVHDLTNNTKFTVKSDGLVFGGPNILSAPLE